MKKFLLIFISLTFFCCSQIKELPRENLATLIDFRPYTSKDFIITTETYVGKYEPVGVVTYKIIPHAYLEENNYTTLGKWNCEYVKSSVLLDSLYSMCNNLGANGIMNFWFKVGDSNTGHMRDYSTISAGGFAIIRK